MGHKFLRVPDVLARTGQTRSTLYKRIAEGDFPRQVKLGNSGRAIGSVEAEVDGWIDAQIRRDTTTTSKERVK